jgi:hypothetical protein
MIGRAKLSRNINLQFRASGDEVGSFLESRTFLIDIKSWLSAFCYGLGMITSDCSVSRRRFFGAMSASAATLALGSKSIRAADAGAKINFGLIGCGGRGTWIASLFQKNGGYNLVAVADYFSDRANAAGDKFQIPPERRFTTLSGYKRLLEQTLDAVVSKRRLIFIRNMPRPRLKPENMCIWQSPSPSMCPVARPSRRVARAPARKA